MLQFQLSVIIPTLNEEKYILPCISNVLKNAQTTIEIIVVDAGSDDNTLELLRDKSIELVSDKNFRGRKYLSLNTGASISSGDILLFLDADTILPKNFDQLIFKSVKSGYSAGAFNLKFAQAGFWLKVIAFLNSLRYRISKNFYGDQGIFCTRSFFYEIGAFPELDIMEAARFCRKAKKKSKLKLLKASVFTSDRRFRKQGFLKVFFSDLKILIKDQLNMELKKEAHNYWNKIDR
ncbi:MAG: TIGR04283 family arsenosugar biosynthesis glycosyltransferase [Cytophagales bacterium]